MTNQIFMYGDFKYGMNTDSALEHLAESELRLAENVDLSQRGGSKKREGVDKINSSGYGARITQHFEWKKRDGQIQEMAIIDKNLCELSGEGREKSVVRNVGSDYINYFSLQDHLYYLTGTSFRRYNGSVDEVVPEAKDKNNESYEDNSLENVKNCTFVVRHPKSQRMFFAGNPEDRSALYYSEPAEPGYVKGTSIMYPSTGDGPIRGLTLFVDAVLVLFQHSVWVWRGIDPETDAVWHKLPTNEGTLSPRTICTSRVGLLYLGSRGIIALSPSIVGVSGEIEPGKDAVVNVSQDRVENLIRGIKHRELACAVFDSRRGLYILSYSDQEIAENNKILVLDENAAHVVWTGIVANDIYFDSSERVVFASNNYLLAQKENEYRDLLPDGSKVPVVFRIKTAGYVLENPLLDKLITQYLVMAGGQEQTSEFNLKIIVDGQTVIDDLVDNQTNVETNVIRKVFRSKGRQVAFELKSEDENEFVLYALGLRAKAVNTHGERLREHE